MAMDYKQVLERLKKKSKSYGDREYMTIEEGKKNANRPLPGHPNMDGFFEEVFYHNKKLNSKNIQVICRNRGEIDQENCSICVEEVFPLSQSKDKEDKKLFKQIRPKSRFFCNTIDRSDDNKLKVLPMGPVILKGILGYVTDDEYVTEDGKDILDPFVGRDISIERSGTDLDTEYTIKVSPKTSPALPDKAALKALIGTNAEDTQLMDLTELSKQFEDEPEKIKLVWEQGWDALKESDDEDEKPKPKKDKGDGKPLSQKAKEFVKKQQEELEEGEEQEEAPAITSFPVLKSRCSVCGEKRHKTPDGNVCPNGHSGVPPLGDGEQPSKPSKKYLKEFPPAPVEEEEEEEEAQETPAPKTTAKEAVDDDEELGDLDAILAAHKSKKGK